MVQTAVRHVIEPVFENEFSNQSYGFRPGRGCKDALREVNCLLRTGYQYIVDADVRQCFDSIPHDALMGKVKERIADTRVLSLIESFLSQHVMEEGGRWTPEAGTPQGAALSPLLCNIYLVSARKQLFTCIHWGWSRFDRANVLGCMGTTLRKRSFLVKDSWLILRLWCNICDISRRC